MRAKLELDVVSPDLIKRAIEVDQDSSSLFEVSMDADKACLEVEVETNSVSSLRAGVNTILRLVKVSEKTMRR